MKQVIILSILVLGFITCTAQKSDTARSEFLGVLTHTEKYKDEKNWKAADQAVVGAHFSRLKK